MSKEKEFNKYELQGPDYHYRQIEKKNRWTFNAYLFARYYIQLELIKKIIYKINNEIIKILDVGCGDGVLFYLFKNKIKKKKNLELYGVDTSEIALKVAKMKNPGIIFRNANVYELPFESNYFDLIFSSDVIEHVSKPDKMLSEIKRVGKRNSFIIISTPIRFTEEHLDKNHYHEFFPEEFKTLLNKFFTTLKIIKSHRLVYYLLYKKKSTIFGKTKYLYHNLINIISIYFNRNPFLKIKISDNEQYTYMFGIGKIEKK